MKNESQFEESLEKQVPTGEYPEGQIQDLGTIALDSVRIQYPQPKPYFVKLRGTPLNIPPSTLKNDK